MVIMAIKYQEGYHEGCYEHSHYVEGCYIVISDISGREIDDLDDVYEINGKICDHYELNKILGIVEYIETDEWEIPLDQTNIHCDCHKDRQALYLHKKSGEYFCEKCYNELVRDYKVELYDN